MLRVFFDILKKEIVKLRNYVTQKKHHWGFNTNLDG